MTESSATETPARSRYFNQHWTWWFMVAVLVLMAMVRLRLLNFSLERDEGEYAYAGQLMLQGIPPYKLAFNMKFPGTYAMYALIMALFGETPAGIHFGVAIITTLTALMLYWLGKKMLDPTAGMVAATSYAVLAANTALFGLAGHATHFAAFFATAGLCLMWKARQTARWQTAGAAGIMCGMATLMKQHAAVIAVWAFGVFVWESLFAKKDGGIRSLWNPATFGIGAALPLGLCCLTLWCAGVFHQFWFWTVDYARQYVSIVSISDIGSQFWWSVRSMASEDFWLWLPCLAGFGMIWFDERLRQTRIWLLGFTLASILTTVPGFYFRTHYFLLTLPALGLLAGCTVSGACELWRRKTGDNPVQPVAHRRLCAAPGFYRHQNQRRLVCFLGTGGARVVWRRTFSRGGNRRGLHPRTLEAGRANRRAGVGAGNLFSFPPPFGHRLHLRLSADGAAAVCRRDAARNDPRD